MKKQLIIFSLVLIFLLSTSFAPTIASASPSQHAQDSWSQTIRNPFGLSTGNAFHYATSTGAAWSYIYSPPALVIQDHFVYFGVNGPVHVAGASTVSQITINGALDKSYPDNNWQYASPSDYWYPQSDWQYPRIVYTNDLYTNPNSRLIQARNNVSMFFVDGWSPIAINMSNIFSW